MGGKKSTKTILGPTETSAIVSLATCLLRAELMGECLLRLCYLFNMFSERRYSIMVTLESSLTPSGMMIIILMEWSAPYCLLLGCVK